MYREHFSTNLRSLGHNFFKHFPNSVLFLLSGSPSTCMLACLMLSHSCLISVQFFLNLFLLLFRLGNLLLYHQVHRFCLLSSWVFSQPLSSEYFTLVTIHFYSRFHFLSDYFVISVSLICNLYLLIYSCVDLYFPLIL